MSSPWTTGPYSNYGAAGYGGNGGNGDTGSDDPFDEDDFMGLLQMAAEEDEANGWPGDADDEPSTVPEPWASARPAREQAFRNLLGGR